MQRNIIPKILRFNVANKQLKSSNTFLKKLLRQEISNKRKDIRTINEILTSMRSDLDYDMCFIYFIHVTTIFFVSNYIVFLNLKNSW